MKSASARRGSIWIEGAKGRAATHAPARASMEGYGAPSRRESCSRTTAMASSTRVLSKTAIGILGKFLDPLRARYDVRKARQMHTWIVPHEAFAASCVFFSQWRRDARNESD